MEESKKPHFSIMKVPYLPKRLLNWRRIRRQILQNQTIVTLKLSSGPNLEKLRQCLILAKKGTFSEKKEHQIFHHPLLNPFCKCFASK